jgi:glycosyltransferase involved in cell wall biosynthesis
MKIALVGQTHPFRGGIAHYTTLLCRALRERHAVEFFSLSRQYPSWLFPGKTQRDESRDALSVPNVACLDSINPMTWRDTANRIGRSDADLALFSWWNPFFGPSFGTVARGCKRRHGVPSCFICHNVLPHEHSLVDRTLSKYAFGSADAFITHSSEDAENLRGWIPGANIRSSPHPTYAEFTPGAAQCGSTARSALGLDPKKKTLLFFGYIRPYKGLGHLLDAVLELDASRYQLLVVGEFYEPLERYRVQLDALKQREQLTLVDRYVPNEDLPLYFAAADLVMVPYLTATQSGIVQMAYGFELPVIATTVGGLPETVIDGETGHLVPPADSGAIAEAVRQHFDHGDSEQYRAAIRRESGKYSWERMVETIEEVGEGLRAEKRGGH